MNTVDLLKAQDKMFEAGMEAFKMGHNRSYGCHFGMRSTRDASANAFNRGWDAAEQNARSPRGEAQKTRS